MWRDTKDVRTETLPLSASRCGWNVNGVATFIFAPGMILYPINVSLKDRSNVESFARQGLNWRHAGRPKLIQGYRNQTYTTLLRKTFQDSTTQYYAPRMLYSTFNYCIYRVQCGLKKENLEIFIQEQHTCKSSTTEQCTIYIEVSSRQHYGTVAAISIRFR